MVDETRPGEEMGMQDETVRNREMAERIEAAGNQIAASFNARIEAIPEEEITEQQGKWGSGTDLVVDGRTVRWMSEPDERGGTVRDMVYDESGNPVITVDHGSGPNEGKGITWAEFAYDENGKSPKYLNVHRVDGGVNLEVNEVVSGTEAALEQRRGGKLEKEAALKLIQDLAARLQQPTPGYLGDKEGFFDGLTDSWVWKSGDQEVTRQQG